MSTLTDNWLACTDSALELITAARPEQLDQRWSDLLSDKEAIEALAYLRESEPEIFESRIAALVPIVGASRARTLRGVLTRRWRLIRRRDSEPSEDSAPDGVDPEIYRRLRLMPRTGRPAATLYNARQIIHDHNLHREIGRPRLNLLDSRVYLERGSIKRLMSDRDVVDVAVWIDERYGCEVSSTTAYQILDTAARESAYHPIRDYMRALRWDGVERLRSFAFTYLNAAQDDPNADLWAEYCLRWIVSAVARSFAGVHPITGIPTLVKADHVLVLAGRQGAGKSTAARILGGDFHADTPIQYGTRDAYQALRGVWCYELAELAKVRGSELEAVKAFISAERDHYRPSYGRCEVDAPRQCVFLATVNPDGAGFLRDPTGERRWWVVPIGERVNADKLRQDRDQIWAEALALYEAGLEWWLSPEYELRQAEDATRWATVDAWQDRIDLWLSANRSDVRGGVTLADVASKALQLENPSRGDSMRLAQLLKARGLRRVRIQQHGQRVAVWKSTEK